MTKVRSASKLRARGAVLMAALALPLFLLVSCIDCIAEIRMGRDGSGTIRLEYHMDAEFAALGELDGNSRWLPLPVGPADFERSAARIPGLRYRSGRTETRDGESVSQVRLDFASPAAMVSFLDGIGASSFSESNGRRRLSLSLLDGEPAPQAGAALELVGERYIEIRFQVPDTADIWLADGNGARVTIPSGWTLDSGKTAVFRAPVADLLARDGVLRLVIEWPTALAGPAE